MPGLWDVLLNMDINMVDDCISVGANRPFGEWATQASSLDIPIIYEDTSTQNTNQTIKMGSRPITASLWG